MRRSLLVKLKTPLVALGLLSLSLLLMSCGTCTTVSPTERDPRLFDQSHYVYPPTPVTAEGCMNALGDQWRETKACNDRLEKLKP